MKKTKRAARRRVSALALLFAVIGLGTFPAAAHHGRDFLLVGTYDLPHPGDLYLLADQGFAGGNGSDAFSASPSLIWGAAPRLALELHSHAGKTGGAGLRYESIAPAVHYQISPPGSRSPWKLGISAEYEFVRGEAAERAAAATRHEGHHHEEPAGAESHGGDRFATRLIVSHLRGASNLTVNLVAGWREGGRGTDFGYAVGYRPDVTRRVGWGLEAQGDFESDGHEALLGLYAEPDARTTLKFGLGTGLGENRSDMTARVGVVLRL